MNSERLLKLAEFLENNVPDEKFDMDLVIQKCKSVEDAKTCNSVCCAIGWTPHVFPDLVEYVRDTTEEEVDSKGYPYISLRLINGSEAMLDYLTVAERLFDISSNGAEDLFNPWHDADGRPTPQMVAKEIREYVANGHIL